MIQKVAGALALSCIAACGPWTLGPKAPPRDAPTCVSDADCVDYGRPSSHGGVCKLYKPDQPARCYPAGVGEQNQADAVFPQPPPSPF